MPNIEELLRRAMAEGKFDDLPGKGKPLPLDELNPHSEPGWELAFKILKDAGYSLPWIETLREIEFGAEAARKDLSLAWAAYQEGYAQPGRTSQISADWERSQQAFKEKIADLNKRIRDYNLATPSIRFQRPVLKFEDELKKITSA